MLFFKKILIRIFLVILIVFLVLPIVMLFQIRFISPIHSPYNPNDFNLNYIKEEFKTKDNITLSSWFILKEGIEIEEVNNYPTIIFLHGWPADKGNILPIFASYAKDYNLFFFDFRGLGESEKVFSTVGIREKEDLSSALDFLKDKYNIKEVGVWGFSMGGAVALMVSSKDDRIKAVVSDSAYASLPDMGYNLYRVPFFRYPLRKITLFYAYIFWGLNATEVVPERVANQIKVPVFLIHSKDDKTIDISHGERLKKAFGDKENLEVWFSEGSHGAMESDYIERVRSFFEKNL